MVPVPGFQASWGAWDQRPSPTSFSCQFQLILRAPLKPAEREMSDDFVAYVPIVSDASFQENISSFSLELKLSWCWKCQEPESGRSASIRFPGCHSRAAPLPHQPPASGPFYLVCVPVQVCGCLCTHVCVCTYLFPSESILFPSSLIASLPVIPVFPLLALSSDQPLTP